MADSDRVPEENYAQIMEEQRLQLMSEDENDPVSLIEKIYQLWWNCADFHLIIISPTLPVITPPTIIAPEQLPDTHEYEFVYPIQDHGYKFSTSKGEEIYSAGKSMCKLYYTIEKIIFLLIERLKSSSGETEFDPETEVEVAFAGHELAQRKGFESIINLNYNVVVTNFDPGAWGQRYLDNVKRFADKGYGYPSGSPRDVYRKARETPTVMKQR